jgi:hypothetical protein
MIIDPSNITVKIIGSCEEKKEDKSENEISITISKFHLVANYIEIVL